MADDSESIRIFGLYWRRGDLEKEITIRAFAAAFGGWLGLRDPEIERNMALEAHKAAKEFITTLREDRPVSFMAPEHHA